MPFSIDFQHRVAGRSLEQTFQGITRWLQDQKGHIKVSRPPLHLEASHGRALQPMGWRKDARKTITFDLAAQGPDVQVNARFIPPLLNASDVQSRMDEARSNWNELLAELWEYLGEAGAVRQAIERPIVDWNASLRKGKVMVTTGVVLLLMAFALSVVLSLLLPKTLIAATGLFVVAVLALMNGAMTIRSARRHLAAQHDRPGP